MISVQCSQLLKDYAEENQIDLDVLIEQFSEWKIVGEESSYFFGKDSYFIQPNNLKHVHLVPIMDVKNLAKWNRNWQLGNRRTSDRFLIYVEDQDRFLLMAIIPEPIAHTVAKMETEEHKQVMALFSKVADEFIYYNQINL